MDNQRERIMQEIESIRDRLVTNLSNDERIELEEKLARLKALVNK